MDLPFNHELLTKVGNVELTSTYQVAQISLVTQLADFSLNQAKKLSLFYESKIVETT